MQAILNIAFPIFGVILAGYLAGRWRILGGEATAALNAFVSFFALPILFFGTLARTPVETVLDPALMAGFGLVVLATFGIGMLSARLAVRGGLAKMSLQGIAASWGNVGYMGVPLCLAAFGEQGLPPAMLTVIVTAVIDQAPAAAAARGLRAALVRRPEIRARPGGAADGIAADGSQRLRARQAVRHP